MKTLAVSSSSIGRWLMTLVLAAFVISDAFAAGRRALTVDDFARLRAVDEPEFSPDGEWLAYSLQTTDVAADKRSTDIWLARWRDGAARQLTFTGESESTPRWSPDGRWLAFLSDRGSEKEITQLWSLSLAGGDAEVLTKFPGSVEDYAISPDGRQVALIVNDPEDDKPLVEGTKTSKPIVINRFYFKEDITGYLGERRKHLYLLDLQTRETTRLTPGNFDEQLPSWSPDGKQIAFVSKRSPDPDRDDVYGIYVIAPKVGATPRLLTTYQGSSPERATSPLWSRDGKQLVYVAGGDPKLLFYAGYGLAVVDVGTGVVRQLTRQLDRNVEQPQWSRDGRSLIAIIEDNGTTQLIRVPMNGGEIRRLTHELHNITALTVAANERIAVRRSMPQFPDEIHAFHNGTYRDLTRQNAALLAELRLAEVTGSEAISRDGTRIGGFVVKPLDYEQGRKYPTILRIHGGPVSQFTHGFSFEWQLLAAKGYAVLAANPRGSSGRGEAFSKAIFADWGNLDAQDVIAHIDLAISNGLADPARLGLGGWSYGGILTNYVIAQDSRFKAATSGSSISNALAGYGTDMYVREYEMELGTPWANRDGWLKISDPFLHADRIKTPTLFLCGTDDFNVPLLNSEQMYQALRSLNIPTQLIIYPGQYHGLTKPSYLRDRFERYLDWYARYL